MALKKDGCLSETYIKTIKFLERILERKGSSFLFIFLLFGIFVIIFILLGLFVRLIGQGSCCQFGKSLNFIVLRSGISMFQDDSRAICDFEDKWVFFVVVLDDISRSYGVFSYYLNRSVKKLFPALTVTLQPLYLRHDLLLLLHSGLYIIGIRKLYSRVFYNSSILS